MKAKLTSKGVISVILALVMILTMTTVGIVSASSAKTDITDTGASNMEVYFTNNENWGTVKLYYWGGTSQSLEWPGINMPLKYTNDMGEKVHYVTIPRDVTGIIFNNGSGTQTVDISVSKDVEAFYCDGWDNGKVTVKAWPDIPAPAGGGSSATEAPTAPPVTGETTRLAIADDTNDRWLGNDDARFYAYVNNAYTAMTKSVDVASGLKTWYCDVAKINSGTNIQFLRASAIAKPTQLDINKVGTNDGINYNKWSASYTAGYPLYKATSDTSVTASNMLELPDGTVNNFGYGIWVDTKGNADTKDFVKIYAEDFVNNSQYDLYLPAYTDWANLKVYTNFPTLTINGQAVTKGQVNTLDLSANTIERTVNISFKRNTSGSTHSGTLHVVRSGASAMLLTTEQDLYTGLAAAYGANDDGSANYEGVAAYKSIYQGGKGKYVCYDKNGTKLNSDDGLKKIKGRGNSTFEASMRLYGKYAMNVTFSEKAPLIEGCASSKKYSLLANNADESLLRNATVYGIADEIGMPYTPNTRLVDLYDNGNYIGAYVLTEKVEYGKNTLIPDAKSADKANEDILAAGKGINYDDGLKQVQATYRTSRGNNYTYQYSCAIDTQKNYEYDGTKVTIGEGEAAEEYTLDEAFMKKYDFLLEHEIETRYSVEPTWFRSDRTGQALVPKYPEFATKKQVEWMIEQYDALEDAAFKNDYARFAQAADATTFADVYLIQELTMNLDAGATSYYILGGKTYPQMVAAPLWDYDWAAGQYNGKKLTVSGEVDVSDWSKVFVKNKSVKIDSKDARTQGIYNLQAKLCQQSGFWTLCKSRWTNKFVPALNNWLGSGKTLLGDKLPEYRTAAYINNLRWGVLDANYARAHSSKPDEETWGTRSTYAYRNGSYDFGVGAYHPATEGSKNYDNTVYYLNDWLTKRQGYMTTNMGLYDQSLYVEPTEPPTDPPATDPPTEKPTEKPTEAPTQAPTDAPTIPPTEPETQAPTTYDHNVSYILGDVDDDETLSIMDATRVQLLMAGFEFENADRMRTRGAVGDTLSIVDATLIQRKLAGFDDGNDIGAMKTY